MAGESAKQECFTNHNPHFPPHENKFTLK